MAAVGRNGFGLERRQQFGDAGRPDGMAVAAKPCDEGVAGHGATFGEDLVPGLAGSVQQRYQVGVQARWRRVRGLRILIRFEPCGVGAFEWQASAGVSFLQIGATECRGRGVAGA